MIKPDEVTRRTISQLAREAEDYFAPGADGSEHPEKGTACIDGDKVEELIRFVLYRLSGNILSQEIYPKYLKIPKGTKLYENTEGRRIDCLKRILSNTTTVQIIESKVMMHNGESEVALSLFTNKGLRWIILKEFTFR